MNRQLEHLAIMKDSIEFNTKEILSLTGGYFATSFYFLRISKSLRSKMDKSNNFHPKRHETGYFLILWSHSTCLVVLSSVGSLILLVQF
jgi:hypothetical protein